MSLVTHSVTFAMAAIFLGIVAWLHVVRSDVDPLRRGISRYASGPYGSAISIAFGALALALASTGVASASGAPMFIAAAALAVVIACPLRSAAPSSLEYYAHQVAGVVFFVSATYGMVSASAVLKTMEIPAYLYLATRALSITAAVTLGPFLVSVVWRKSPLSPFSGILQRCCFGGISGALLCLSYALWIAGRT